MEISKFIIIGENIHCTRVFKRDGKRIKKIDEQLIGIVYETNGKENILPIPDVFIKGNDWESGKVKHCSVAIWQGMYGHDSEQQAGINYLQSLARKQEKAGAAYLDVNVDEFSVDIEERVKAMEWLVPFVQKASSLPLSIDSSNEETMRAGLNACDTDRARPMVNSISLERIALIDTAAEYKAAVVASAAGENNLPTTAEERLANFQRLIPQLMEKGIELSWIHADPLVYTISTDSNNGKMFLESVAAVRREYGPDIHIIGGLSNVSFGMPSRKLINQVFSWLAVEAGGDGGIVDPLQINADILRALDTQSEPFKLAKELLLGKDEFGMNFISAHREGKLS